MIRRLGPVALLLGSLPWAGLVAAALAIGGCAAPAGEAPRDTIVTESDEPEVRKRARIRLELALGYYEQGKTNFALDEIKQVLNVDPNFPDAYNVRGLIYMQLNDMRQAEDSFRRAVSLNPRDANSLHNLGWLQCQERRFDEAQRAFDQALASPLYADRAKTFAAQGLCQARAGRAAEGERSLARAYELDAGNPIVGYNLANLLYARGELQRAQFYIRRLNNSELANSESLWLGVKVERKLGDQLAARQLGDQLKRRFPQSRESTAYERGAFDD